jgi:hypothetical protein
MAVVEEALQVPTQDHKTHAEMRSGVDEASATTENLAPDTERVTH